MTITQQIEAEFQRWERWLRSVQRRRRWLRGLRLWARRTYRIGCNCPRQFDRRAVTRIDVPHHWACGVNRP